MDIVFAKIADADAFMNTHEPYKKIKSDVESARKDIEHLVHALANIAIHLASAMPQTSQKILEAIKANKKPENLFPRL
jgi:methionyl-tRNA synthetase